LYTAADFELGERQVIRNENFQNSRWQTAVILKSLYRHISAKNHPISMKFCTQRLNKNPARLGSTILRLSFCGSGFGLQV